MAARSEQEQINKIAEDIQNLSGRILRPVVVAIDGASGSGKSTIAQVFAGKLQAVIIPLEENCIQREISGLSMTGKPI
jgi:adenylylsulfate kinase-like enzyme